MKRYGNNKGAYVAPYTSLVTSSLMGKTRLMKEIAKYGPTVYLCLRLTNSGFGYPKRSPMIADYLLSGIEQIEKRLNPNVTLAEVDYLLSTFKFSAFIEATLHELTTWITEKKFHKAISVSETANFQYRWLWQFFAEPENEMNLERFWNSVIGRAQSLISRGATDGKDVNTYGEYSVLLF